MRNKPKYFTYIAIGVFMWGSFLSVASAYERMGRDELQTQTMALSQASDRFITTDSHVVKNLKAAADEKIEHPADI